MFRTYAKVKIRKERQPRPRNVQPADLNDPTPNNQPGNAVEVQATIHQDLEAPNDEDAVGGQLTSVPVGQTSAAGHHASNALDLNDP